MTRGLDFTLPPRPIDAPATKWLREALRSTIVQGTLRPGSRIPSSRELARTYQLARGTVVSALDDLRAEGYLISAQGSGMYVCARLPNHLLECAALKRRKTGRRASSLQTLSSFGKALHPFSHHVSMHTRAFRTNLPALAAFPTALWARTVSRSLRQITASQLVSTTSAGYEPLRVAVSEYLISSRGANCTPEDVVIVSGVREALDLTSRILLDPGSNVLIEDPGYQLSYTAFRAARATLVPMSIDAEGAAPATEQIQAARLLYLTPGHQFPTGVTMSAARRLAILHRVTQTGAYIFEDDYDSEFRYSGKPLPVLQGLDQSDRVILAGSFNKTMFPALRIGYVVVPPQLKQAFLRLKALTSVQPIGDQLALSDFLHEGYFGRHLRQMRKLYADRYCTLSECVERHLSEHLKLSPIQAGLQTAAWLRPGLVAESVRCEAAQLNVDVLPLSLYSYKLSAPEGIQLGFAAIDQKAIEHGVQVLKRAIDRASTRRER